MTMQTSQPDATDRFTVRIDPDFEDIIPVFLSNRKKDLQTLRRALAGRDFATIQMLGHRMKGDGGGYGFNQITEIGASMERAAALHDPTAAERHIAQLEDFLARVEVVYL